MNAPPFRAGGSTQTGLNRRVNEDYLLLDPDAGLVAVFDAGGSWEGTGERTGPISSAIFQSAIREGFDVEPHEVIKRAFLLAGETIREEISRAEPETSDCSGASVALALVRDGRVFISWLGDATAYRVTGDQIEPLTRPHTFTNELIRQGRTAEAAAHPNFRNVLLCALGGELPDPLEVVSFVPQPGDRLVLTTDGITNHIPNSTILSACRTISDPTTCAEAIIEHALTAGSRDNCTCAVIAFELREDGSMPEPVRHHRAARKWWRFWM